ncbi:gluconate 5-dehydrogenase [candidate division KSB1 bacterium]|nr:MAG: gluconate 5-dehydrogenase [candidate division KSB1 bacterium]
MHVWDLFSLRGKVAIVTGGATGLGLQMATALAEAGATVIIASRRLALCEEVASQLRGENLKVFPGRVDVTDPHSVNELIKMVVDKFDHIDILVNNAGMPGADIPVETGTLDDWQKLMDANVASIFLCSQAVGKVMIEQKRGKIINIASMYGIVGTDQRLYDESPGMIRGCMAYAASKGGVIAATRFLAVYWAKYNINVNCISPGGFYRNQDENFVRNYCYRTPLGRMGGSDDLKGAVGYLSSAASDYVTGHNLVVDGGFTVW